jgi:hypothetical protein
MAVGNRLGNYLGAANKLSGQTGLGCKHSGSPAFLREDIFIQPTGDLGKKGQRADFMSAVIGKSVIFFLIVLKTHYNPWVNRVFRALSLGPHMRMIFDEQSLPRSPDSGT